MVKMTMAGIELLIEMEAPDTAYARKKECAHTDRGCGGTSLITGSIAKPCISQANW